MHICYWQVIIGYLHETLTVTLTHTVVRKSIPMIIELFKESKFVTVGL